VVDESHRALITNKSRSSDQTLTRCGMGKLLVKEDGLRVALSGTPFRGKPENLWERLTGYSQTSTRRSGSGFHSG
jgi:hypothetical protein